jgi:hypothetical protein
VCAGSAFSSSIFYFLFFIFYFLFIFIFIHQVYAGSALRSSSP